MSAEPYLKKESQEIISSAFEVHNTLGHGLNEKPHENALVLEFLHRDIPFTQQAKYEVHYRDQVVGHYIPDIIAFDKVIIDTKTIDRIGDSEMGQMLNYLRICKLQIGIHNQLQKTKTRMETLNSITFISL